MALVGSHARGTARADSDIDLIVLTTDPQYFRADTCWLTATDWNVIEAARRLDLGKSHVYSLIKAFGLARDGKA